MKYYRNILSGVCYKSDNPRKPPRFTAKITKREYEEYLAASRKINQEPDQGELQQPTNPETELQE